MTLVIFDIWPKITSFLAMFDTSSQPFIIITLLQSIKKPTSLGNPNDDTKDRDTVLLIIEKYKDNPIIRKIRENTLNHTFSFPKITRPEITKIIKELDTSKSIGKDQIPASFIKIAFDILDEPLTKIFNRSISENKFCEEAKTAIIPPIFKKDDRTLKENYRPVSILTTFGKIFEKQLKNMVEPFVELILSVLISAYRKFYSSNHVLMKIIEDWRKHLDDGNFVGTILMDLSKAFDFVPHDLLIAKLHAYGFDMNSLIYTLISILLDNTNRKVHTTVTYISTFRFYKLLSGTT